MSNCSPERACEPERELVLVHALHRPERLAQVVARRGLQEPRVRALQVERVGVLVDVDRGVGAEVDRIRAGDERAVVVIGIEHLDGHRFPAAGGSAVDEARPALADATELLLDRRNQLRLDRIAVRAEIRRVHRIRVVVVRVGVVDLGDQDAREVRARPLLVELVGLLLLDAVVSRQVEALAVVGREVRVRRLRPEAAEVRVEVIL